MHNRLDLHEFLCDLLGSRNVYYQAPETVKMQYPAIIYSLSSIDNRYANGGVYSQYHNYEFTVIDPDPDSEIVEKASKLPRCRFSRSYSADRLNHSVFTIFY